ncbi:MAG: hypothetical protein ABI432_13885 [Flavobacteriales bacterium]
MRSASTLVLGAVIMMVMPAHGQFETGDLLLSVGGSYKAKQYDLKETLNSEIDLQLGYYPIPRVGVGLIGNWGLSEFDYAKTNEITGVTETNYKEGHWGGIGPYVRGHLGSPDFSVFGQLSAVFGRVEQDSENNLTDGNDQYYRQEGNFQQYGFSMGVWWYFTRRFGAEILGTSDWTFAKIRSGNVSTNGELDSSEPQRIDDTGGGGSIRLIYWFRLDKGAKKPPANGN